MATELDSMVKEYEKQSLMLSEDLKKAKEQDIVDMNNSMQSYQLSKLGPNGELTQKQAQLEFQLVEKFKTAVFYLNTNNGSTLFQNGKRVHSKSNRILIFDGHQKHCGVDCTDEGFRLVVNFNWIKKKT